MRRHTVLGMAVAAIAMMLWLGSSGRAQTPQAPAAAQPRPPVFVAIYERGSAWDDGKGAFVQTGIQEHMQFLRANSAKLVGAAPFEQGISAGGTDRAVGMVVVMAASQEEAQALISADPAIAGNLMKATVRRWLVDRVKAY
ncbi:MAG: hypothetical protein ACRD5F_04670 [Candidatus Acidiferrales bacterium]